MIFKELDPLDWQDQSALRRRTADEQLPYYLRRHFGDSDEVDVINQLRVSTAGVTTQVDHLIMHPYGLVVVDSTSVSGSLQVMDDGRWICRHQGQLQVIRSPITQAYLQTLSLKAFLEKKVRQKGFFERVELDVLVAVSDAGVIEWPSRGALVEVCGIDEIAQRVRECVARYRSMGVGPGLLVAEQRRRLGRFLCTKHRPAPHRHD